MNDAFRFRPQEKETASEASYVNIPIRTHFGALDAMTPEQRRALIDLVSRGRVNSIDFYLSPFGLPDGYIGFMLHEFGGHTLQGGIDPTGRVST